jgi:hypothetical protein
MTFSLNFTDGCCFYNCCISLTDYVRVLGVICLNRRKMPPANKAKLQSEKLALSKHVRKLAEVTEQPVALSSSPTAFISGIPRRTRASVELTDDLLLQIKKGLELSVANKSKVKVKRLTSAVKQQVSTKKSPPKTLPVGANRRLRSSRVISEEVQPAVVAIDNVSEQKLIQKTGISADPLNKTPPAKDAASDNLVLESRVKASGTQRAVSSKSTSKYEKSAKKPLKSDSSPKAGDDSPSNAYSLRSKPETFFPDPLVASSSKSTQKVKRTERTSLPLVGTTALVPSSAVVATAPRTSSKQKKRVSSGDSSSVVPGSKKRHAVASAELENRTEKRFKSVESSRKFSQLVQDVEKLETPRQAYGKRKSDRDVNGELQPSAKKRTESEVSTSDVSIIKDRSEKRLSVRVTRIKNVYGDKSDTSTLSKETPYWAVGDVEDPTPNEAERVRNVENAHRPFDYAAYPVRNVDQDKPNQQPSSVAGWGSFPETSANVPITSSSKRGSGVRWDTAAVKTRLIESIHAERG